MGKVEITPPVGIYHRMWGAASHDRAEGVHRPLYATVLWLANREGDLSNSVAVVGVDHCILDDVDVSTYRSAIAEELGIPSSNVMICLSHTHAAGLMSRTREHLPGGELIAGYLDSIAVKLSELARSLRSQMIDANIMYGKGQCDLARDRDYWDWEMSKFVCGYNPNGNADSRLMAARIEDLDQRCIGTVVNYACHPTTLAWDNRQISPDYIGAMRETVEAQTGGHCLFLQGASGDLGPLMGFVGETEVADRNGRWLGYSVLATLESLPPQKMDYAYCGAVVSGTSIGTWKYQPYDRQQEVESSHWRVAEVIAHLPYRHDLATLAETRSEMADWERRESQAKEVGDATEAARCHAMVEQKRRQAWRLESIPAGKCFPLRISWMRLGQSIWLFLPGEHYQVVQTTLRRRYPQFPWIIVTIANGWQPGYVPPANKYGYGIYQEEIALVAAGSEETVIETIARAVNSELV